MVTGRKIKRKTNEVMLDKAHFKIRKKYKRYLFWTALALCLYQIKYSISSCAADFLFSGKDQKPTKLLRFANRQLNKNICKCQIMAEKCEYYMQKIENI